MPYNASMRLRLYLLPLLLIVLVGCKGGSVFNAPIVPAHTLLNSLPKELQYQEPGLLPDENGWLLIANVLSKTPRLEQTSLSKLEEHRSLLKLSSDAPERVDLEQIFEKFSPHLDAAKKCLDSGHRGSIVVEPGDGSVDILTGLRVQLTLRARRAALRLALGDVQNAVEDYKASLKLLKLLNSSGPPVNYAVIAASLWTRVDREVRWAACHPNMTETGLFELLAELPEEKTITTDFERSIRVELYNFVREEVLRLSGPGGNSLVPRDAKESYRDFDSGWTQADEIAAQVLDGHESPFDRKATVDSAVEIYRESLKNVGRKWSDQLSVRPLVVALVKDWPMSRLSGGTGESKEAEAELEIARQKLLAAENPYGKFALWYFLPFSDHSEVAPFRTRADINATKTVLGLRMFKLRNGRFPGTLNELATIGVVKPMPLDPFIDLPFEYDLKEMRISSKGPGRFEAQVKRGNSSYLSRQDYVWHFADLKEPSPKLTQSPTIAQAQNRERAETLRAGARKSSLSKP